MSALAREIGPDYLQLPLDQQEQVRRTAARLVPMPEPKAEPAEDYEKTVQGKGHACKAALLAGYSLVDGGPNTLTLDLDGDRPLNEECLKMLCDLVQEVPTMTSWKSKSGGTHVLLRFEKTTFTEAEAVAMECALGSDQKRACLYVLRLKNGVAWPRVLFKPPTNEVTL